MKVLVIGLVGIMMAVIGICLIFLLCVAIWQYCDGRYGDNPWELFCDYFYNKGQERNSRHSRVSKEFAWIGAQLRESLFKEHKDGDIND